MYDRHSVQPTATPLYPEDQRRVVTALEGKIAYSISTKTSGYTETATSGEVIALLDLEAGFTVTLPTAVGNTAKLVYKKMQAAGSMIIDGAGSETIDGALTATLTAQYASIALVSNNTNWVTI